MRRPNPFPRDTIPHMLYHRAANSPGDRAYVFPESDQTYTWLEVWNEVQLLAKGLMGLGVQKGDRVALLMKNRMELLITFFAASCVGAITVPLNAYSKKNELAGYLQDATPAVLLTETEGHGQRYPALLQELAAESRHEADDSWLPRAIYVADERQGTPDHPFQPYAALLRLSKGVGHDRFEAACAAAAPQDPLLLLYTSGTSGKPKAVLRTTASFLPRAGAAPHTSGRLASLADRLAKRFTILALMPLYHLGGIGAVFSNLSVCNVRLVMLSHFNPSRAIAAIEGERCHIAIGTPYMIQRMVELSQRSGGRTESLLGVIFSGAAVNGALLDRTVRAWNLGFFLVTYGSSEAGGVANGTCFLPRRKSLLFTVLFRLLQHTNLLSGRIRPEDFRHSPYSLAGKIEKGVEVKIVHPDTGVSLPTNEQGEILIRSHRVMRYAREELTEARFTVDGWFRSGDLGFIDDRGLLTIAGRLNRIINRGGEKISPAEVEHVLLQHEEVEDALVLGVPDELYGEQVCACIVPRRGSALTEDRLRLEVAPRLSAFKVPHFVVFMPSLPLSATGKISVAELRQLAVEHIGELRKHA